MRCSNVVCRAAGNGVDPQADTEKQREVAKMLLATQKNLLLINNSRVKMQEELAIANRKIQDLEREVERLREETAAAEAKAKREAQLREAQQKTPPPFAVNQPTSYPPPQQQQQQPQQYQQQPQQYQQPPQQYQQPPQQYQQPAQQYQQPPPQPPQPVQQQQPVPQQQQPLQQQQQAPPPPPPQPAPPAVINLTYITGWHNAFIHYCVDGKSWTTVPGTKLQQSGQDHNTKTISIEGRKMEFVMNNGENDWDSPGRYTDKPKNYEITSPGNYKLKSGKIEKLQ